MDAPTNIGIVGAGQIGSTLADLLLRTGRGIMLAASTRQSADRAAAALSGARSGTVEEAIDFGEAIIVAVPLKGWPDLAREQGSRLVGKVTIDTSNIAAERDGAVAEQALAAGGGSGLFVRGLLPDGVKLAKAFNTLWSVTLAKEAGRAGEPVAIPIAADDTEALRVTAEIVRATGYVPVEAGSLADVRRFNAGAPAYKALGEAALRAALASAGL